MPFWFEAPEGTAVFLTKTFICQKKMTAIWPNSWRKLLEQISELKWTIAGFSFLSFFFYKLFCKSLTFSILLENLTFPLCAEF